MQGDMPLEAVYGRRLELIRPRRQDLEALGRRYIEAIVEDAREVVAALRTNGAFESRVVDMTTTNAAALAQRKSVADAQQTIRDNAVFSRDALSGVDLDTEAVDLMRFQQAYSAASRVIQVARDTIQSILDIR